MKAAQHLLIYDKDCPFCCWYTNLFIQNGFLAPNERITYTDAIKSHDLHFNHDKARNKIAFVNTGNGDITYGIDSMLTIIGRKFPWMKAVGSFIPIHWLLSMLYNFLSYNRKMIAAVDCQDQCGCVPERSYLWRTIFIGMSCWVTTFAFSLYLNSINSLIFENLEVFIYISSLFILQGLFYSLLGNKQLYDYLGHLAFVLIISSFFLIISHFIILFLSKYSIDPIWLQSFAGGSIVTALIYMHQRRVKLLHASPLLNITLIVSMIIPTPFLINLYHL